MKLNDIVAQVIVSPNIINFTTVELRFAYLALSEDKTIDPSVARRFVYAELLKLVKKGWLKKTVSKKKGISSFIKTELFDPVAISVNSKNELPSKKVSLLKSPDILTETLIKKLNLYKNNLLAGLGEAEEYKDICNQFPELQTTLQPKYNEVREHNTKLLGSIKAVENLINR